MGGGGASQSAHGPSRSSHSLRPTLSTVNFKESGFKSTESRNGCLPPCLLNLSSLCLVWEFRQIFLAGDAERAEVERAEMRRKALRWRRRGGGEQEPREAGGGGTWGFTGAERQSAQGLTVRSARVFGFLFFR